MLNKTLYKVFLISVRIVPIIIAFIYVINSVLSYIGIDSPILSYIVFSMFILFMYAVSLIFKFCSLHRMFIHYITLNTIITAVDYNCGIPVSDNTLFIFYIVVLLTFIVTIIYLAKHELYQ